MSDLDPKMEEDYSIEVDNQIPVCNKLASEGQLNEALDVLLILEKKTRLSADMSSCSKILVAIVWTCFECQQWTLLNEQLINLAKKRNLLKQSITKMIQECMKFVEQAPDSATELQLITTLRQVTEGKIYVENERARLTMRLSVIYEQRGDISDAASVLQELQVETYGTMPRQEKVEFILEQMRLCTAKQDTVRAQIISKKINTKFFQSADLPVQQLKIKYYELMIKLSEADKSFLTTCHHYRNVYDTPMVKEDTDYWQRILKLSCIYVLLAPYYNEQSDTIHRILKDKNLKEIADYKSILTHFTTMEIIFWDAFILKYETILRDGTPGCTSVGVFAHTEQGDEMWSELHIRVIEHNLRVMSIHYSRISIVRLLELTSLTQDRAEEIISNLVVNKTIYARIDRHKCIVSFRKQQETHQYLTDWSRNIENLMGLVSKTVHLINKEDMMHSIK